MTTRRDFQIPDHIFRVAVQGSRERIDDRPWQPVGTVAFHALDDYCNKAGLSGKASAPRRVQALLRLPPLSSKETAAIRESLMDAVMLMEWLTYGAVSAAPEPHPSPWPNVQYSNPLLWLNQQTRMINAPPGGRIEFEATFEGLILLSAFFGICRGTLRWCDNCAKVFVNGSWYRYRQVRCPSCHERRLGAISMPGMPVLGLRGAAPRIARQWETVRRRMWMRISRNSGVRRQWGETVQQAYREWMKQALDGLDQEVRRGKQADLKAWEHRWAPPVSRGRPRKFPSRRSSFAGG